jgi:hypothetical protein
MDLSEGTAIPRQWPLAKLAYPLVDQFAAQYHRFQTLISDFLHCEAHVEAPEYAIEHGSPRRFLPVQCIAVGGYASFDPVETNPYWTGLAAGQGHAGQLVPYL